MLMCPLCGANDIKEQPEPSLHAFTTIFECGTKIDQAFNDSDWTYAQKCNEPIINYHLDLLSKPDTLIPIYANQKIPTYVPKSIFLIKFILLFFFIWTPLSAFRSRFFLEKTQSFPRVNFSKKRAPLKSGRNDINCYFKKRAKLIFDFRFYKI